METPIPSVDFGDLVRMLAEGIADAQRSLDHYSAGMLKELAETEVEIVPEVVEEIEPDGDVSFKPAPAERVSLLDLGITPTFYQFAKSTVEVAMDLSFVADENENGENTRESDPPVYALRANTASLQQERRLHRTVEAHSRVTTTLVPVPGPPRLEPARPVEEKER